MKELSKAAQSLWAKKTSHQGDLFWLPLFVHMRDSTLVAEKLWNRWLCYGIKDRLMVGVEREEDAKKLLLFLAAAHDLGKATPVFQVKEARPLHRALDEQIEDRLQMVGLPIRSQFSFSQSRKTPHALATQVLLEAEGCHRNVAAILGAHHGKPQGINATDECNISAYSFNYYLEDEGREAWRKVQKEIIRYALNLSGFLSVQDLPVPDMSAQVLLSGLLIMTDWIASNEMYFPYIHLDETVDSTTPSLRATHAWCNLSLTYPWVANRVFRGSELFQQRFTFDSPNALQVEAAEAAVDIDRPGILIIEAPMGQGKTEAALACAEIFAGNSKRSGVFFALPTQATSDGIFPRLCQWVGKLDEDGLYSIGLAHGKAQFNEDYQALKEIEGSTNFGYDDEDSLLVHEWFEGKKKTMLADFVVGTIDQLLLAALRQKHVMLRHLGLAQKVVIIDECHAYDAYMNQYLNRALHWLGVYGVPVIVLSATLPASKRQSVIEAYLNKKASDSQVVDLFGQSIKDEHHVPKWVESVDYPLITYTDGGEVKQRTFVAEEKPKQIQLEFLPEDKLVSKLDELLSHGGCAGVVVNTVKRSQELARILRKHFGEEMVLLLHSRFLAPDRKEKENKLLQELGKPDINRNRPEKRIVIGTQVIEQSLDIDFDVLVTDIAPMDLLLQRIGRLHRHERQRPEKLKSAFCFIMGCSNDGFEEGTEQIYGKYLLMRTKTLLPDCLALPHDIPFLVQKTYEDKLSLFPEPVGFTQARAAHQNLIASKEERAKKFRIAPFWPGTKQHLCGWLDTDMSHQHGEATVRDSDESIEVLLVQENEKGQLCFLPWVENGREILETEVPSNELGKAIARQRIRLPRVLCSPWSIDNTIKELEQTVIERLFWWQQSPWLKGDLIVIVDQNYSATLNGYRLTYHPNDGLLYEKEVKEDESEGV